MLPRSATTRPDPLVSGDPVERRRGDGRGGLERDLFGPRGLRVVEMATGRARSLRLARSGQQFAEALAEVA